MKEINGHLVCECQVCQFYRDIAEITKQSEIELLEFHVKFQRTCVWASVVIVVIIFGLFWEMFS